jgi:hypothetical protein
MDITLKCGCKVTGDGKYVVGIGCQFCKECNAISGLHPFGSGRIAEMKLR